MVYVSQQKWSAQRCGGAVFWCQVAILKGVRLGAPLKNTGQGGQWSTGWLW